LGRLPTRKEISDKFRKNIKLADGRQEDYSENFVKDAMTIYERILSSPPLAQLILEQEKRDGHASLWNNIRKLAVLATKTADQEERKWVMDSLEDYQINHGYMSGDLSKSILQGDKSHVGIIPLLIFKYKVLRRWVSFSFTALGLCPQDVATLQEKTKTHSDCFAATKDGADQSWIGKLRPSGVAAFRLLEARSMNSLHVGGVVVLTGSCSM